MQLSDTQKNHIHTFLEDKTQVTLSEIARSSKSLGFPMPMQSVMRYLRLIGWQPTVKRKD